MAASTVPIAPEAPRDTTEVPGQTITKQSHELVHQPAFNPTDEAAIKTALDTARKLASGHTASPLPEISVDETVNMAILIMHMTRMLNASAVANHSIIRAAAYMRSESRLTAGHALRQARSDRRLLQGQRQQHHQKSSGQIGKDETQVLKDIDPNGAKAPSSKTDAPLTVKGNVNQDNARREGGEQANEATSSSRNWKKKGPWNRRYQKTRNANHSTTSEHKHEAKSGPAPQSNAANDGPAQNGNGGHTTLPETVKEHPSQTKTGTTTKAEPEANKSVEKKKVQVKELEKSTTAIAPNATGAKNTSATEPKKIKDKKEDVKISG